MGARIPSAVDTGEAGLKGMAVQKDNAEPLAKPASGNGLDAHEEPAGGFKSVQTEWPAAGQAMVSAQRPKRLNIAPVGGADLSRQEGMRGHASGSFMGQRGNNPVRSPSRKSGPALDATLGTTKPKEAA